MNQLFRRSPDDADLERIAEAVETLDQCRHEPMSDESELRSRGAYVDLLGRVGELPEGSPHLYEDRREEAESNEVDEDVNHTSDVNGKVRGKPGRVYRIPRRTREPPDGDG